MIREYYTLGDSVTIKKASDWSSVKAVDFGGMSVSFSGQDDTHYPFYNNKTLTSVTNGVIVTDNCHNLLSGCTNIKTLDCVFTGDNIRSAFIHCDNLSNLSISAPNATNISYAFQHCKSLTSFDNTFPKADNCRGLLEHCTAITKANIDVPLATNTQLIVNDCKGLTECYINMPNVSSLSGEFSGCTALSHAELIVKSSLSAKTASNFAIPSAAPCRAFRYVDDLGNGLVRITFTANKRPSYSITTSYMTFFPDGIHYLNEDCTQELISSDYGTEDNPINVSMIRYATDDMCNIFRSDNLQFSYDVWMVAYNNSKQGIDLWIDDGLTRIAEIPYGGSVKLHVTNTSITILN